MRKGLAIGTILVLIAVVFAAIPTNASTGDPYADTVISYTPGPGVSDSWDDPESALGFPGWGVALGNEGSIILGFTDNVIIDGGGPDFTVIELGNVENGEVSVSKDGGVTFVSVGIALGSTSFDLSGTGLSFVNAVMIVDLPPHTTGYPYSGFDLDEIMALNSAELIEAMIDIDPDTLNKKSKGKWITCYISLPENFDVNDIIVSSVKVTDINGNSADIPAVWGEVQDDVLMIKFDRSAVQAAVVPGDATITVTGELTGGMVFEGSDTIRVIDPGK